MGGRVNDDSVIDWRHEEIVVFRALFKGQADMTVRCKGEGCATDLQGCVSRVCVCDQRKRAKYLRTV